MLSINAVVYQEDDGRWTAEIPSCPGCAASGLTRAEALSNLREAAELYFEDSGEMPYSFAGRREMERVTL